MHKLFLAALVAVFLAGCSSTPTTEEGAPVEDKSATSGATTAGTGTGTSGVGTAGVTGTQVPAGGGSSALRDPNNILSKRSVYFDFDSFVVKDEYRPIVEAHAKYLAGNRSARLTIQGNTDERGGREYNLALGQKRADAVLRTLVLLGVQDAQLEAVSFGEERPADAGHDEAAWAKNRRAELKDR